MPDPYNSDHFDPRENGFPCEDRAIALMIEEAGRRAGLRIQAESRQTGIPLVIDHEGVSTLAYPDGTMRRTKDVADPFTVRHVERANGTTTFTYTDGYTVTIDTAPAPNAVHTS